MFRTGSILYLILGLCSTFAQVPLPYYKGVIKLPVDLYTLEGTRLEIGRYDVEVRLEKKYHVLVFLADGKAKTVLSGQLADGDSFVLPATIPLIGTHYLQSSMVPVEAAQERQFSKTGLPHFAEQTREWNAAIRAYKSIDVPDVWFVFEERQSESRWKRVDFKLVSKSPRDRR